MKSRTKTHQKMTKCISGFKKPPNPPKKQKKKNPNKTETLTFLSVVIFSLKVSYTKMKIHIFSALVDQYE